VIPVVVGSSPIVHPNFGTMDHLDCRTATAGQPSHCRAGATTGLIAAGWIEAGR
jgi:hypothetical protein